MNKYIDADKLVAEIERRMEINKIGAHNAFRNGKVEALRETLEYSNSLQQEQPEGNLEYWLEHFGMPKENIDNCITQIAQGYGACRYLEGIQHGAEAVNELAKQEQPEDLEKEINACWRNWLSPSNQKEVEGVLPKTEFAMYARHFYGLRNRALEEAARHVYESWMGGTMDDVRRDMVELGKVLNARKEE